jgi:hypothetical protein
LEEGKMAQRKKSVAKRRQKAVKRGKAPKRVKAAKRKATKHSAIKAKSRIVPTKAKTKRAATKILIPKKAAPKKQQGELPIEVVKVETVEEPTPGVVIVTEYETVRVRRPKVTVEEDKLQESAGIPESNGK